MAARYALVIGALALALSSCAVQSPAPYYGDLAGRYEPLRPNWNPDEAVELNSPRPQRQREQELYDYYYEHTTEGSVLRRRAL